MRTRLWLVATGLAVALGAHAAQAQPRGSYLGSCNNVRDTGGRDPQITANCKDMSGRWQFASLRYRDCVGDIGNNNGQLVCNGGRPGDGPGGGGPGWNGPGGGQPGAGLPQAAEQACRQTFGGRARLGQVTPQRHDRWQVILVNDYGRKASCTVNAYGRVLQWTELGRR